MASAPVVLKRTALAVGALLVVALGVVYGSRMQTTTQVVSAVPVAPSVPLPQAPAAIPLEPVAAPAPPAPTPQPDQGDALQALIEKVAPSATASAAVPTGPAAGDADISVLRPRALTLPVQGVNAAQLTDTYTQARAAGTPHEAIDIMAARGTPVLAVEDGKVAKLFLSKPGGITIYQFDPQGQYAYYYAHLDRYADGLAEGATLRKGQVIGYVGSTGNASPEAPHLHFAIFKLGPEHQWWRGTALNPYWIWREAKP